MLYRTHRPQTWNDIAAQEHVTKTLQQEIKTNTCAHAFLFCGPRGVGKTTSARILAKSLNCKERKDSAEPCNTCQNCTDITKAQSVDVIEIDAASHTGVDNVRENIIENARFTPTQSTYKIFIIDEIHMLSTSAFNALLKTIEEPPAHAIFIMATTELHKIPATILSRCQRFDFKHISQAHIIERLKMLAEKEHITIDDETLEHVAWRAQGSMRDAESLLGQIFSLAQDNLVTKEAAATILPARNVSQIITHLTHALEGNLPAAIQALNTLIENGSHAPHIMDDCIDITRSLLLLQTTQTTGDSFFNQHDKKTLEQLATKHHTQTLLLALDIYINRKQIIGLTPILHLPLELAAIDIALHMGITSNPQPMQPQENNSEQQSEITPSSEPTDIQSETKEQQEQPPENKQELSQETPTIANTTPAKQESNLTIETIKQQWPQFLESLHEFNHSLPFIMKTCTPLKLTNNELTVTLPYEFHKKKIDEPSVKHNILQALKQTYNTDLSIQALIDEQAQNSDEIVAKVLNTFGGKIVSS